MIFQLKVTLKGFKPPVWRRIEVESDFTFHDLHNILQVAFDWWDYHLHEFEVRKTNGMQPKKYIFLSPPYEFDLGGIPYQSIRLDEHDVTLEEFFQKEKDRCIYTYDFGDDWEHEVVLEKILEPEPDVYYPRCVKVMRSTPDEDSRGEVIEFGLNHEDFDNQEELDEINAALEDMEFEGNTIRVKKEAANDDPWIHLFDLAEEFKRLQPWKWMWDNQLFAVQDPKTGTYAYCSVLGANGEAFGLSSFIGDEGLIHLDRIYNNKIDEYNILEMRSLTLEFCDRQELNTMDYNLIKQLGRSYRGKKEWPLFRSYKPGYSPWLLDPEECRIFITIIEQALEVVKMAKIDDSFLQLDGQLYTRVMDEDGNWIGIGVEPIITYEPIPLLVSDLELQKVKHIRKSTPVPFEYAVFFMPTAIQENPNERPYYPYVTLALETERGMIVYYEMNEERDYKRIAQNRFINFVQKLDMIPQTVLVPEEMVRILQPISERLNIQFVGREYLPNIEEAKSGMINMFNQK